MSATDGAATEVLGGTAVTAENLSVDIYADSGHGFLDQYPEQFADHVLAFLNGG
jgi:high-affinity K+ transport system ATPase subunit B